MNPPACKELVKMCGSQRSAANQLGVPPATFRDWISQRGRGRYERDPAYRRANLTWANEHQDTMVYQRRKRRLARRIERKRRQIERLEEELHAQEV